MASLEDRCCGGLADQDDGGSPLGPSCGGPPSTGFFSPITARPRYGPGRVVRNEMLAGTGAGVTVTTNRAHYATVSPDRGGESLDQQARRKGARPIQSADDLAQDGVFDADEELDAFLAHVAAMRHADLA